MNRKKSGGEFIAYVDVMEDKRRKLHPEQYNEVIEYYNACKSQRATAFHFGISRRLVSFILYPDKAKAFKEARKKLKPHLIYYDKEKHRESIAKTRARKRALGYPRTAYYNSPRCVESANKRITKFLDKRFDGGI